MSSNKKVNAINSISGKPASVIIEQPEVNFVALEIKGTAPLIQNCFSQKSMEQMLRKHMGLSVPKEAKKPREVVEAAMTRNVEDKICIPPTAFKKAMLEAANQIKSLKKTHLRTSIFIEGQSVPITFANWRPRLDIVKTSGMNRQPDVRFRPEFQEWKARMVIEFSDTLSMATVVDLLHRAGRVGVGEWRPQKDGTFGTFRVCRHITDSKEAAEVREQCSPSLVPLYIPEWALDADFTPEIMRKIMNGAASGSVGSEDVEYDPSEDSGEEELLEDSPN